MAKDRKPENGATRGTASRPGGASRAGGARGGKGGRTRPPTQVVAQQRPWGLIIAAVLVVVFAAGAIGARRCGVRGGARRPSPARV